MKLSLLLDEGASAMDAKSRRMVHAELVHSMNHRTMQLIAHHLATVQRADRIVVLDHGRIIEIDPHAELLARGGLYARLAALEFDGG